MSFAGELAALLISLLVGYFVRRYFIFKSGERKTNLPFIKGYNLLTGSKDIIFTNNKVLAVNAHDRHQELGDTFGCYFGQNMQVFSRDLELIQRICIKDFTKHPNRYYVNSLSPFMRASLLEARGDSWHRSRKAVGAVLKPSKLKMDSVDTEIDETIGLMLASIDRRIGEARRRGEEAVFDVYQFNETFFMQSILKIIYNSSELVDFDQDYNDVVYEMHKFVNVNYELVARMCFLIPVLTDLVRPLLGFFDHGKYLAQLTAKLEGIIGKTINGSPGRHTTIHSLISSYRRGELSRQELLGNSVFLMLAGFATSVDSMSVLMWQLAKNQAAQDKLRADLLQYGEGSKYMQQCLDETLRLFPGALTNRDLGEDVYHNDFRLVKGLCFNISIYSIHRDPKHWGEDANEWKPERFDPEERLKHHPAQFLPFGVGPRNCVGYHLAKLELYKYIARFFLKYKVEACEQTQPELQFVPLGALPFALPIQAPVYLKLTPITVTN